MLQLQYTVWNKNKHEAKYTKSNNYSQHYCTMKTAVERQFATLCGEITGNFHCTLI